MLQVHRSRSRDACVTELNPGGTGGRETRHHTRAGGHPGEPAPPLPLSASPHTGLPLGASRSSAAPSVSAWGPLPTWLGRRAQVGWAQVQLDGPGWGSSTLQAAGPAAWMASPCSAVFLLHLFPRFSLAGSRHPLTSERLRGILRGTRHTGDTSRCLSHTRHLLSCPRVPRGLWACIWVERHPSSQPALG